MAASWFARRPSRAVAFGKYLRRYCTVEAEKSPVQKLPLKTRAYNYVKMICEDYKLAVTEIFTDAKSKPVKAAAYIGAVSGVVYMCRHNPDEEHYVQRLLVAANDLRHVSDNLRNKSCEASINQLVKDREAGLLRRTNLGLFSLIWRSDYSKFVDVYAAHCPKVSWRWHQFPQRVVDVGLLDKWFLIDRLMVDYDVNNDEWSNSS